MPTKNPISPELSEILARHVPGWYQLADGRCQKVDWKNGVVPGRIVDSVEDVPEDEIGDLEEDEDEIGDLEEDEGEDVEVPWTMLQGESVRLDWLMEATGVFTLQVLEEESGAEVIVRVTRPAINNDLAALDDPPAFLHWPPVIYLTDQGWSSEPTAMQPSVVPEALTSFANEVLHPNVDMKAWTFEIKLARYISALASELVPEDDDA